MDLETLFLLQMTVNAVLLFLILVMLAGVWAVLRKADQPGWPAIVPVYNIYMIVTHVARLDNIWFILTLVPIVNIYAWGVVCGEVARRFGRGVGSGIGLSVLPYVYWPLVGFSDDRFIRKLKPVPGQKMPDDDDDDYDDDDYDDDDYDDDQDDEPPRRRR